MLAIVRNIYAAPVHHRTQSSQQRIRSNQAMSFFDPYFPFYHQRRPASPFDDFFRADEPVAVRPRRKKKTEDTAPIDIPVYGPDDPVPSAAAAAKETKIETKPAAAKASVATKIEKPAMPKEEAAVRVQAAARGLLARKAVRALRAVACEAEEVVGKVAREAEAMRGDARARVAVGEQLMRLLFRLDAVRGAREFRRRVAKRILALQDAVDAMERTTVDAAAESDVTTAEVAESVAAADSVDHSGGEVEVEAETEVDGDQAVAEARTTDETEDGTEQAPDANAEDEWEMVTEEPQPAAEEERAEEELADEVGKAEAAGLVTEEPEEAAEEERPRQEQAGATAEPAGLDTKKLMEMVAALCEQKAQQCALIGALAERVEALESAVRRVEDAERRRRLAKKLKKEGKGSNQNKCNVD